MVSSFAIPARAARSVSSILQAASSSPKVFSSTLATESGSASRVINFNYNIDAKALRLKQKYEMIRVEDAHKIAGRAWASSRAARDLSQIFAFNFRVDDEAPSWARPARCSDRPAVHYPVGPVWKSTSDGSGSVEREELDHHTWRRASILEDDARLRRHHQKFVQAARAYGQGHLLERRVSGRRPGSPRRSHTRVSRATTASETFRDRERLDPRGRVLAWLLCAHGWLVCRAEVAPSVQTIEDAKRDKLIQADIEGQ